MLILAGVTIATLTGDNGILTKATESKEANIKGQAEEEVNLAIGNLKIEESQKEMTQEEKRKVLEDELKKFESSSTVSTNGTGFLAKHRGYDFNIDSSYNISVTESFDAEEWDKTAAPEDVFIWQSDDPNNEGYGVVVGYTANVDNYPILRYPSRCTGVQSHYSLVPSGDTEEQIRSYTKNIKKIELPETVTVIGEGAFSKYNHGFYFDELEEINIPSLVTEVPDYTFWYCEKLKRIVIPSNVLRIGCQSFYRCSELADVKFSEGLTIIDEEAFTQCVLLKDITIPNSVTKIGSNAFFNCEMLENIKIGKIIENRWDYSPYYEYNIGETIFTGCYNLKKVVILEGTTAIGSDIFYTDLGYSPFSGTQIQTIEFPSTIESIESLFKGCESLTNIKYKDIVYTSKSELVTALNQNGVNVKSSIFENTGLSE